MVFEISIGGNYYTLYRMANKFHCSRMKSVYEGTSDAVVALPPYSLLYAPSPSMYVFLNTNLILILLATASFRANEFQARINRNTNGARSFDVVAQGLCTYQSQLSIFTAKSNK